MRLAIEPDLIEAARRGRGDGMERLLQTLWPHAYRIARSIVQNDTLAEDAAQEACAIVYRDISRLRSTDAFRVWIYRIVAREAVRLARRDAARRPDLKERAREADVDIRLDVMQALRSLRPDLRAVVVLHYYCGLNSSEISSSLGIPAPTVRFRMASARKRLKLVLRPENSFQPVTEASQ